MRKRILSLICVMALCIGMLPTAALAAAPSEQVIYVGNVDVASGGYWTTDSEGNVTAYSGAGTPSDNYIHYSADTNTLTLHNATIREYVLSNTSTYVMGAGIGVFNQNGDAELTITLEGTNTIAEVSKGIYVLAHSESTGDASLTITGEGSLNASGSQIGILVQSNSGGATLEINSAEVKAVGGTYTNYSGVMVQAQNGSDVSLTVDGGSLTASGDTGICFWFGTSTSGSGTPNLTVSNNAIVRASGNADGIASNASTTTPSGTGIVFDGRTGTVYGSVTLQENITIGEGESLNIPNGANLNIPNDKTLTVNGGTLTGDVTGPVIYKVTGVSLNKDTLTLDVGGSEPLIVTVQPSNATNKGVTWSSDDETVVTVDANGKVTAVSAGTATITATAADGSGKSATCTVTVTGNKPSTGGGTVISRPTTSRIAGDDRFETAVEVASQLKKELGVTKFSAIVVAYSDEFADALSASAFAQENEAPVLVVNENNEEYVKKYIEKNLAKGGKVYIMGGNAVVTERFEESLLEYDVSRFGGSDRYETNLLTLKQLNLSGKDTIIIASGLDYADALSASSTGLPVMIVGDKLTESQIAFLNTLGGNDTYYIVGGTSAVSSEVEKQLKDLNLGTINRLAGDDRYETSVLIAETFYEKSTLAYLASGDDFPDGLTGGVLARLSRDGKGAPLLLVNEHNTSLAASYIEGCHIR